MLNFTKEQILSKFGDRMQIKCKFVAHIPEDVTSKIALKVEFYDSSYHMFDACKEQFSLIDSNCLNGMFLEEIKKRKSATEHLKDSPSFLRQMTLSLNLSPKNQATLIRELYKPINYNSICTIRI